MQPGNSRVETEVAFVLALIFYVAYECLQHPPGTAKHNTIAPKEPGEEVEAQTQTRSGLVFFLFVVVVVVVVVVVGWRLKGCWMETFDSRVGED